MIGKTPHHHLQPQTDSGEGEEVQQEGELLLQHRVLTTILMPRQDVSWGGTLKHRDAESFAHSDVFYRASYPPTFLLSPQSTKAVRQLTKISRILKK